MKSQNTIKLCLKIVLLSLLFSGCVSSNVSKSQDEKALRVIEKDIDDFRADLRALERVRGEPLDRGVFIALDDAKRAVKQGDRNGYRTAIESHEKALKYMRDYLIDENTIKEFGTALDNMSDRFDNKVKLQKYCEREIAKLKELARKEKVKVPEYYVKDQLERNIIPEFSIGPPSTIIDAADYFKQAGIEFDDPYNQTGSTGFGLILKLRDSSSEVDEALEDDPFSHSSTVDAGIPVIPEIKAKNISLYDAMKLVCDVMGYEFVIRGYVVVIRPFGECDDEDDGPDEDVGVGYEDVEDVEF